MNKKSRYHSRYITPCGGIQTCQAEGGHIHQWMPPLRWSPWPILGTHPIYMWLTKFQWQEEKINWTCSISVTWVETTFITTLWMENQISYPEWYKTPPTGSKKILSLGDNMTFDNANPIFNPALQPATNSGLQPASNTVLYFLMPLPNCPPLIQAARYQT